MVKIETAYINNTGDLKILAAALLELAKNIDEYEAHGVGGNPSVVDVEVLTNYGVPLEDGREPFEVTCDYTIEHSTVARFS